MILPFRATWPRISPSGFLAADVVEVGDVEVGGDASAWPAARWAER